MRFPALRKASYCRKCDFPHSGKRPTVENAISRTRETVIIEGYKQKQGLNENVNFQRGLDSKEALKVGRYANPIILAGIDEEYYEEYYEEDNEIDGLINRPDLWARAGIDLNTWQEALEVDEVKQLLNNWEREVNQFMGAWVKEDPNDEDWDWWGIKDLEGEVVEYQGEIYEIPEKGKGDPKTGKIQEGMDFKRGMDSIEALGVGMFNTKHPGDIIIGKLYTKYMY
jgi:hypothetical protein